jgi:tungstate transport system ATP-binding protein
MTTPALEPVYALTQVTRHYDGRLVLEIPALEIHRGEIFALVGPSGAGKSTLLRLLNFLEAPSSGAIRFLGVEFRSGADMPINLRRQVTTVFQRPMLLDLNVWDNVAYGLRLRGERDTYARTQAALDQVGLLKLAHQQARTLSGGEAQRVALARAIVLQPQVLLLDEPTANLDPGNVSLIEDIARQMNRQAHTTLVLVTHNVFQARRLADRVGFLMAGQLVEIDAVKAFFEAPRDPRTASFVRGDMVY